MCNFYGMLRGKETTRSAAATGKLVLKDPPISFTPDLKIDLRWSKSAQQAMLLPGNAGATEAQVVGVAKAPGAVLVFHRGYRMWGKDTFEELSEKKCGWGPCMQLTESSGYRTSMSTAWPVSALDPSTGERLGGFGGIQSFLPHSLTVSCEGQDLRSAKVWLVDVGAHTVSKFAWPGQSQEDSRGFIMPKLELQLGTPLEPGNDDTHFCQPTDVSVNAASNVAFISDGYCNARIVRVNATTGDFLGQFGGKGDSPGAFQLPHSIAVSETHVFVADRMNARVQIFTHMGLFISLFRFQLQCNGTVEVKNAAAVYAVAVDENSLTLWVGVRGDKTSSFLWAGDIPDLLKTESKRQRVVTLDRCDESERPLRSSSSVVRAVHLIATASGSKCVPSSPADVNAVYLAEASDSEPRGHVWRVSSTTAAAAASEAAINLHDDEEDTRS